MFLLQTVTSHSFAIPPPFYSSSLKSLRCLSGCLLVAPSFQNVTIVVTDPEDPRFDLEKLIAKWEAESQ